jgi:hypothetical protein
VPPPVELELVDPVLAVPLDALPVADVVVVEVVEDAPVPRPPPPVAVDGVAEEQAATATSIGKAERTATRLTRETS